MSISVCVVPMFASSGATSRNACANNSDKCDLKFNTTDMKRPFKEARIISLGNDRIVYELASLILTGRPLPTKNVLTPTQSQIETDAGKNLDTLTQTETHFMPLG